MTLFTTGSEGDEVADSERDNRTGNSSYEEGVGTRVGENVGCRESALETSAAEMNFRIQLVDNQNARKIHRFHIVRDQKQFR